MADSGKIISNPGSALGEAIGAMLEGRIHEILEPLAKSRGYVYIQTGAADSQTGRAAKLILTDDDDNDYNLDAVIINNRFQPLVLVESKYIRYKKHNRDKASWICTAHTRLRQRYTTVRKSIAILMGSWSRPSKRVLRSFEVELFEVTFEEICNVLRKYEIEYNWAEKDQRQARESWGKFGQLPDRTRRQIARQLLSGIEAGLRQSLQATLDDSRPRKVSRIVVVVRTSYGETFTYNFDTLKQALKFIRVFDEKRELDTTHAPTLILNRKPKQKQG